MGVFQSEIKPPRKKSLATFSERSLFPIVDAARLLQAPSRKKILNEIRELSGIPQGDADLERCYQGLYQAAIDNFVEFVQLLPVNNEARLGSLLDEGLIRALYALQLYRQDHKIEEEDPEDPEAPRLTYVLFSASLMLDVGFVIENRTVLISDQKGNFIRQWLPYQGAMQRVDGYYKIRHGGGIQPWVARRLAPIFAKDLLPEEGYFWIADPNAKSHALKLWLALLYNDQQGAGELGFYFFRANETLEEFRRQQEYLLMITDIEGFESKETELGEAFMEWLQNEVRGKKLSVNKGDSKIRVLPKGIILETKIFDKFLKEKGMATTSWKAVVQQLKSMGATDGNVRKYYTQAEKGGMAQATSGKGGALFGESKKTPPADPEKLAAIGGLAATAGFTNPGLWAVMLLGRYLPQNIWADYGVDRSVALQALAMPEQAASSVTRPPARAQAVVSGAQATTPRGQIQTVSRVEQAVAKGGRAPAATSTDTSPSYSYQDRALILENLPKIVDKLTENIDRIAESMERK
jgi:hypothetical protein